MNEEVVVSPTPAVSPTPTPAVMNFYDALKQVAMLKKIHRLAWPQEDHVFLQEGQLRISRKGVVYNLVVTDGDLSGEDWVIYE